ncbi:holin [Candidatus Avoscillospira sp. LCP25S3_F1]|uniref:holin n=1 Tax=Candidatus Avoscillospira sp. LCP25S3_F1 TaxID=3438825 RepID=UPI003F93AA8B
MNGKQKLWLRNTGILVLQAMAQTALATIGTMATFFDVSWKGVVSATLMAGVLAVLGRIAKLRPTDDAGKGEQA